MRCVALGHKCSVSDDVLGVFDENGLEKVYFRSTAVDGLGKVIYMLITVVGLEVVDYLLCCSEGLVIIEFLLICGDGLVQVALLLFKNAAVWSCNEFFSILLPHSEPNLLHQLGST